jgi:hypothetical protein
VVLYVNLLYRWRMLYCIWTLLLVGCDGLIYVMILVVNSSSKNKKIKVIFLISSSVLFMSFYSSKNIFIVFQEWPDLQFQWEELEGFVMQPDGLMFSWHEPFL